MLKLILFILHICWLIKSEKALEDAMNFSTESKQSIDVNLLPNMNSSQD